MPFFRSVGAILWKDLRSEWRTKETVVSMAVFALLISVMFSFALQPGDRLTATLFPGILWVGFFFAGNIGLARSFAVEQEESRIWGILLGPVNRSAVYFAKVVANWLFLLLVELISVPVFLAAFDFRLGGSMAWFLLILLLGSLGFVSVGTLLSAITASVRKGQLLLPIVSFPLLVPVLLGAVLGMAGVLRSDIADSLLWIKVLIVYDVVFLAVPYLLFDYLVEV